jgi:hypothetical protein
MREPVAAERVDDSVRCRYRHLMADDALRRHRIQLTRERLERERMVDKYGAEEFHGEQGDE